MRKLMAVMLVIAMVMVMGVLPVMAQAQPEATENPDELTVVVTEAPMVQPEMPTQPQPVVVNPSEGVLGDASTTEFVIGAIVLGLAFIVMEVVAGWRAGNFQRGLVDGIKFLTTDGGHARNFNYAIESTLASKLTPEQRQYWLSWLNVIDSATDFAWTDMEDDAKAWIRSHLDETQDYLPVGGVSGSSFLGAGAVADVGFAPTETDS